MEKTIWVLGSKHPNAHKSISWNSPFPNFANCDILIVNLQSLGDEQFAKRGEELFEKAQRYVFDLLMTGEKEAIIVLSPKRSCREWLPLFPILRGTAQIDVGKYSAKSPTNEYMKEVETCSFYIHAFDMRYFKEKTDPDSKYHENYPFTGEASEYTDAYSCGVYVHKDSEILNKANQSIGCRVCFVIDYGYELKKKFSSGDLSFLPPPTKCTAEAAIDVMVNILTGGELKESPPQWESKIELPGLQDVQRQIIEKEREKEKLIKGIEKSKEKKDHMIKFRRLLWTKGTPLENIVKETFILLEFPEIRRIRAENLEDWVIDFKFIPNYKHAVFEIKGADERTSLADLTQCNKWVEDYLLDQKAVKGIFVPNQYRLADIRTSQAKKEHFENNELEYAQTRDICILPSHEIFNAVVEKMRGNAQITRKFIEEKIATIKGICKLRGT